MTTDPVGPTGPADPPAVPIPELCPTCGTSVHGLTEDDAPAAGRRTTVRLLPCGHQLNPAD